MGSRSDQGYKFQRSPSPNDSRGQRSKIGRGGPVLATLSTGIPASRFGGHEAGHGAKRDFEQVGRLQERTIHEDRAEVAEIRRRGRLNLPRCQAVGHVDLLKTKAKSDPRISCRRRVGLPDTGTDIFGQQRLRCCYISVPQHAIQHSVLDAEDNGVPYGNR